MPGKHGPEILQDMRTNQYQYAGHNLLCVRLREHVVSRQQYQVFYQAGLMDELLEAVRETLSVSRLPDDVDAGDPDSSLEVRGDPVRLDEYAVNDYAALDQDTGVPNSPNQKPKPTPNSQRKQPPQ